MSFIFHTYFLTTKTHSKIQLILSKPKNIFRISVYFYLKTSVIPIIKEKKLF